MAPYHLIKTPLGEAMSKMQSIHLMHNKELTKHIHKELHALKKFCTKYELYETLLQALQFEFRFGFHQLSLNENYWNEFHQTVCANMVYMQLSEIQHRVYLLVLSKQKLHENSREYNEVNRLLSHQVITYPILQTSARLRIIKEAIMDLYAHLREDYNGIIKHNMNIVELLESKPYLVKDGREISLIYTNIVTALANAGQRKQLAKVIDSIIEKLQKIAHHQTHSGGHELEIKAIKMLTFHNFADMETLLDLFQERYHTMPVSIKHNLYYYFTIALLKNGDHDKTLDWINEAQAFYRKHKRTTDVHMYTLKVVHVLIHFELGNYVYVQNQLDTFLRVYKPEQKEKDINYVVMSHLKKAIKAADSIKELKKLKERLLKDFKGVADNIYLDMGQWLESIIANKQYHQTSKALAITELKKK